MQDQHSKTNPYQQKKLPIEYFYLPFPAFKPYFRKASNNSICPSCENNFPETDKNLKCPICFRHICERFKY